MTAPSRPFCGRPESTILSSASSPGSVWTRCRRREIIRGVIAQAASYEYASVEDILERARQKGEPPFLILLDEIEDPHNLGAIIRTANLAGGSRRNHYEAQSCRADCHGNEGFGGSGELYAGGEGDESGNGY